MLQKDLPFAAKYSGKKNPSALNMLYSSEKNLQIKTQQQNQKTSNRNKSEHIILEKYHLLAEYS